MKQIPSKLKQQLLQHVEKEGFPFGYSDLEKVPRNKTLAEEMINLDLEYILTGKTSQKGYVIMPVNSESSSTISMSNLKQTVIKIKELLKNPDIMEKKVAEMLMREGK
jgi:hypothetical protein